MPTNIEVRQIGHEGEPVVVIDDFLADPAAFRAAATDRAYDVPGDYYPGVRAAVDPAYFNAVGPILSAVLRRVFGYDGRATFERAYYALVTTPPEQLSLAQRIPHIDGYASDIFAVLHYLTPDDHGGTAFYRHRSTGFETIDAERQGTYFRQVERDFARVGEPPPAYIRGDTEMFEQIGHVEPRFNRALVYRGNLLHCSAVSDAATLSADAALGRLTVTSFLKVHAQ